MIVEVPEPPIMESVDLGASGTLDGEDDFGGFSSGKSKKKGKKGKVSPCASRSLFAPPSFRNIWRFRARSGAVPALWLHLDLGSSSRR